MRNLKINEGRRGEKIKNKKEMENKLIYLRIIYIKSLLVMDNLFKLNYFINFKINIIKFFYSF